MVLNFVANGRAKLGKPANLENWMFSLVPLTAGDSAFGVNLEWDEQIGVPGAILVKNNHETEFFLKSVILEDVPGVGRMHFVCNSWIYPARRYKRDRVFFINKVSNDRFGSPLVIQYAYMFVSIYHFLLCYIYIYILMCTYVRAVISSR